MIYMKSQDFFSLKKEVFKMPSAAVVFTTLRDNNRILCFCHQLVFHKMLVDGK